MTALAFLNSAPVQALLERAATAAGVPLSLHFVERNQEGPKIAGWGQCAACRHVHTLPNGGLACRLSRTAAAGMALRQQRPMPFVCHLGFACVAVPLLPDEGFVMTLGPYCPMEEQRSLEDDIRAGFAALAGAGGEELPVALDDIHRSPATAVPAVAAWAVEALRALWAVALSTERALEAPEVALPRGGKAAPARPASSPSAGVAEDLAAALTAGSTKDARALILAELEEMQREGLKDPDARRARVIALAAGALERVARAGVPSALAWQAFPAFVAEVSRLESPLALASAAAETFGFLRAQTAREQVNTALPDYPELHAIIKERLLDGITLEEVARQLGQTPSAISHRLKRKFDMSFSDYVGRLRIEQAKALFRRTALKPAEVAQRVGIADLSNFARLFRKVEGMSPAAYRKRYGKDA